MPDIRRDIARFYKEEYARGANVPDCILLLYLSTDGNKGSDFSPSYPPRQQHSPQKETPDGF